MYYEPRGSALLKTADGGSAVGTDAFLWVSVDSENLMLNLRCHGNFHGVQIDRTSERT